MYCDEIKHPYVVLVEKSWGDEITSQNKKFLSSEVVTKLAEGPLISAPIPIFLKDQSV
jgi:hypothetical protein